MNIATTPVQDVREGRLTTGRSREFHFDIPAGMYDINLQVATDAPGRVRLSLDGDDIGSIEVPATGGAQDWATVTLPEVAFALDRAGATLAVEYDADGPAGVLAVGWVEFSEVETANLFG